MPAQCVHQLPRGWKYASRAGLACSDQHSDEDDCGNDDVDHSDEGDSGSDDVDDGHGDGDDGMMATTLMPMATGVWEDNDPSLSVQCAEGRPRALPRVEVDQVEYVIMIIIVIMIN